MKVLEPMVSKKYLEDDYDEYYDFLRTCIESERYGLQVFSFNYLTRFCKYVWRELNPYCQELISNVIKYKISNGENKGKLEELWGAAHEEWKRTVNLPPNKFESREYILYCLAAGLYECVVKFDDDGTWEAIFNYPYELQLSPEIGFSILEEMSFIK